MIPPARCRQRCSPILVLWLFGLMIMVRAEGQSPSVPTNRIPQNPNLAIRSTLIGHLPKWVTSANDAGAVPDSRALELTFVLTRAPSQQSEFNQLLADQQNPTSSRYHRWLTPKQLGDEYGPTARDVGVLTHWLTSQGFQLDEVTPSRMFVRVSATTGIGAEAFSTNFRMFRIPSAPGGKTYLSATTEPSIPSALTPIVAGITGLTDVPEERRHLVRDAAPTLPLSKSPRPETSLSNGEYIVSPGDFAVIYDVKPVYQDGFDGTGQRIAIVGLSQVNSSDITNFEARLGLPSGLPNVVVTPSIKSDPGPVGDDYQEEATLDVERVVGTAPGAQIDLIITCDDPSVASCSPNWEAGIFTDANHNVQTLLDPIMTISFGGCEATASSTYTTEYDTLFSQAAAEGISVLVSSGDSGVSGCSQHDAAPPPSTPLKSPNFICSSGSVTCVGGTEFADTTPGRNPSTYWREKNYPGTQTSALMYIPEGAWNEPGETTPFNIDATGGGKSAYIPKPAFQVGVGVPADGYRDTPDVSFSAAKHDAYFGCYTDPAASSSSPNPCVPDPVTTMFVPTQFHGTSAAAPSMAAITALLNQKLGSFQGNLNPLLYSLAANPGNGVFHDVTVESSGIMNCTASVPSMCNNSVPGASALTGGLAGYTVSGGYDQATGWGSIDVANLLAAATSVMSFTVVPSSSSLSISAGATQGNQDVVMLNSTGGFGGTVALTCAIKFNGMGSGTEAPTCSFLDPYVTLVSGGTGAATMSIATVAPNLSKTVASAAPSRENIGRPGEISLLAVLLAGLPTTLLRFRRRKFLQLYWVLTLGIGLSILVGCGRSGSTAGSYTVTVTGTAMTAGTTMTAAATIDLTVK